MSDSSNPSDVDNLIQSAIDAANKAAGVDNLTESAPTRGRVVDNRTAPRKGREADWWTEWNTRLPADVIAAARAETAAMSPDECPYCKFWRRSTGQPDGRCTDHGGHVPRPELPPARW